MDDSQQKQPEERAAGDTAGMEAMQGLLVKHRTYLYAYLYAAVMNHHDAEDLLQEVSKVVIRCWSDYSAGTNFRAWAREIARRRVLAHVRSRDKYQARFPLVDPIILESLDAAAEELEQEPDVVSQRRRAMRECQEQLRGTSRRVLFHRYAENLSVDAIAKTLSRTVTATYSLLKRARAALRRCVELRLSRQHALET